VVLSRLDNIIARNKRNRRPNEKVLVTLVLAGIVFVLILLAIFTDLGVPPVPPRPPASAQGSAAPGTGSAVQADPQPVRHVHGVLLRAPAATRAVPPAR
jgi:hypothetical protein